MPSPAASSGSSTITIRETDDGAHREAFALAEGPVVTEDDVLLVSDVLVGGARRFGEHATWSVVGWRASDAARQFVADRLGSSGSVPTATEVDAAVLGSYRPA